VKEGRRSLDQRRGCGKFPSRPKSIELAQYFYSTFFRVSFSLRGNNQRYFLDLGRLPGFHIGTRLLGLMGKEGLSKSSQSGPDEIRNPVEFLATPFPGNQGGSKGSGRVEDSARDGSSKETEESQRESDRNGRKTSFGVAGRGLFQGYVLDFCFKKILIVKSYINGQILTSLFLLTCQNSIGRNFDVVLGVNYSRCYDLELCMHII
jgi:hypothetical protein